MTKKPYPKFKSDEEEQAFLDTANLEDYELTAGGVPMRGSGQVYKTDIPREETRIFT